MPLMPAIRPIKSINNPAERPISAPPIAPAELAADGMHPRKSLFSRV